MVEVDPVSSSEWNISSDKPPIHDPCTQDAVHLTVQELNKLSMNEREQVLFDIHGILDSAQSLQEDIQNDPNYIPNKLEELQIALDNRMHSKGFENAYDLALKLNPDYVTCEKFRLMFLRADVYNVQQAADRLVFHLNTKLELFGKELLCKDLCQDDLDPPTLQCLYSGWLQDLPLRDVSGRLVTVLSTKLKDSTVSVLAKLRRIFYGSMVLWEDEVTQRNGRVLIVWGTDQAIDRMTTWKVARMLRALPVRCTAVHSCFEPEQFKFNSTIVALALFAIDTFYRLHVRTHTGTFIELKYNLQTFGIPVSTLPITMEGEVLLDAHREKWAKRRREERMRQFEHPNENINDDTNRSTTNRNKDDGESKKPTRVDTPRNNDVLLGREKVAQEHLGNFSFRYLIDQYRQEYEEASKHRKTELAKEVVQSIYSRRGRFLKDDGNGWVQVCDTVSRQKVSSCFRSFRKTQLKKTSGGNGIDANYYTTTPSCTTGTTPQSSTLTSPKLPFTEDLLIIDDTFILENDDH